MSLMAAFWSRVSVNSKASSNSRCQLLSDEIREALGHLALRVELQKLFGHVAHLGFDSRFGAVPGRAAHAVELRCGFARSAEALDQIHARERYIQLAAAGVFEQHVIALGFALLNLFQADELSDAVLGMDDVIARLQIELISGKCAGADVGSRGRATMSEASNRSSDPMVTSLASVKTVPRAMRALNQENVRRRPAHIRAPGEIFGRALVLIETELIQHAVLVHDVGDPFDFARGGAEEHHACPCSTRLRASAIATCMLPWNAIEGRVEMWKFKRGSVEISSSRISISE